MLSRENSGHRANSNDSSSHQLTPQILQQSNNGRRDSAGILKNNSYEIKSRGADSNDRNGYIQHTISPSCQTNYTHKNGQAITPTLTEVYEQPLPNFAAQNYEDSHQRGVVSVDDSTPQPHKLSKKQQSCLTILSHDYAKNNTTSLSSQSTCVNGLGRNVKSGAIQNLPNIDNQESYRQGGIGVYQPVSPNDSALVASLQSAQSFKNKGNMVHSNSAYGGVPTSQGKAIFSGNIDGRSRREVIQSSKTSQADLVSMSSFVPSMHMASHAPPARVDFRQIPEKDSTGSQIAAMTDPGQLALESWRGPVVDQATIEIQQPSDSTTVRKQNLNKLDQNFHVLMEQNQRLEQEIREMNDQFTIKQNQRLAQVTAANEQASAVKIRLSSKELLVSENKDEQILSPVGRTTMLDGTDGQLIMTNLQSSFDERCQRTKQIVTQLAQKLHAVKRETFTELDKIQTRQSVRNNSQASNSNSRSPNPTNSSLINKKAIGSGNNSRKTSREQPSFNQSGMSLQKINQSEIVNQKTLRNQQSRNNLNATENNVDVRGISPIRASHTQQNLSVASMAGAFNFRKLKPQESIHTSMQELPSITKSNSNNNGEGMFSAKGNMHGQAQHCFDNSPVPKESQEFSNCLNPGFSHESIEANEQQRHFTQGGGSSNNVGTSMINRQAFNDSLMQMIPGGPQQEIQQRSLISDINPNQTSEINQEIRQNNIDSRFSFQKDYSQIQVKNGSETIGGRNRPETTGSLASQLQQFEQQQNNKSTLGPDNSPLNVNGAAQLSNILQQINHGGTQQIFAETQSSNQHQQICAQQTIDAVGSQPSLLNSIVSPNGQQIHAPFFMSQDTKGTRPIMTSHQVLLQQQISSCEKPNIIADALNSHDHTKMTNSAVVLSEPSQHIEPTSSSIKNRKSSRLQSEETFNQLRKHLQGAQDVEYPTNTPPDVGRNFMNGTNLTVSDQMTSFQTFDKMHIEIMQLQEKIKNLETQMVTSPSMHGDTQQTQNGICDQKMTFQSQQKATLDSSGTIPYKHDSKHMQDSGRQSVIKMTVPKTVVVQPFSHHQQQPSSNIEQNHQYSQMIYSGGDAFVNPTSAKNEKQDKKKVTHNYAISHRPIYSQPEAAVMGIPTGTGKIKEKKQSLLTEYSADNYLQGVVTHREKKSDMTPLQREMSDLMSQSQPDLGNVRQKRRRSSQPTSQKTIRRIGSRKSSNRSKSPLRKSQNSKHHRKLQGSSRADQKSLNKRDKKKSNSSSQVILTSRKFSKQKEYETTSRIDKSVDNSASFIGEVSEEQRETRIKNSFKESQLTDGYIVTNSEYTVPSEINAVANTHSTNGQQQFTSSQNKQLIISQMMSPKLINGNSSQLAQPSHHQNNTHVQQNASYINDSFNESTTPATSQQNQTLHRSQNPPSQKHTFPLRVRKHQNFMKGPDCPSIPSQSTGRDNKFQGTEYDQSESNQQLPQTVDYEVDLNGEKQIKDQYPTSSLDPIEVTTTCVYDTSDHNHTNEQQHEEHTSSFQGLTCQEDILRQYDQQIVIGKQNSLPEKSDVIKIQSAGNSRNLNQQNGQDSHQSEISKVQTAFEVSDYLFRQPGQTYQPLLGAPNGGNGNWTNQTSRFQLAVSDPNSSQKMVEKPTIDQENEQQTTQKVEQYKRGRSNELRESGYVESTEKAMNRKTPTLEYDRALHVQESEDDTTDENQLEQRPFSNPDNKKAKSKAKLNKDLPLQQHQLNNRSSSKIGVTGTLKASEKSRITFLEQRNRHLELELKRHQVHLGQTDELDQKYKCLKLDYKQLLQSFERSEEIRREQKELINEQSQQLKHLKAKCKRQDVKMSEIAKDIDALRLAQSNDLSGVIDLSKIHTAAQSHSLRNSKVNRASTQPVSQHAYNSSSQVSHRSPCSSNSTSRSRNQSRGSSSQVSASQFSRSQLQQNQHNLVGSQYGNNNVVSSAQSQSKKQANAHQIQLSMQHMSAQQQCTEFPQSASATQQYRQVNQPQMLASYAGLQNNGVGMLDFSVGAGSGDDLARPEDYSVLYDVATSSVDHSKVLNHRIKKHKGSRNKYNHRRGNSGQQRSQSRQSESLEKSQNNQRHHRKKSHKKHHKHHKRHHSGKKSVRQRSNSVNSSRRSITQKSAKKQRSIKQQADHQIMMMQQPEDIFSMDQSLNFSGKQTSKVNSKRYAPYNTTTNTGESKRKRSRSRKHKKTEDPAEKLPGYIFNIQTSATDIMRGIHKFQSQKGSRDHLESVRQLSSTCQRRSGSNQKNKNKSKPRQQPVFK